MLILQQCAFKSIKILVLNMHNKKFRDDKERDIPIKKFNGAEPDLDNERPSFCHPMINLVFIRQKEVKVPGAPLATLLGMSWISLAPFLITFCACFI